jgi:hypothetical protein
VGSSGSASTGVDEGSRGARGRRCASGLGHDVGWLRSARSRSERVGRAGCAGENKEERMLGRFVLVLAGFRL